MIRGVPEINENSKAIDTKLRNGRVEDRLAQLN